MNIKFIRHATLLLNMRNKTLLIDPMLSSIGSIAPVKCVPNQSNNPLVELPVSIDYITNCDAVLITHTHRDHFDDAAINAIPKNKLIFCQPKDEYKIGMLGFINVVPIKQHFNWGEIVLTRTPARHGHGIMALSLAPVSGFIITASGEPTVYLTGDTICYSKTKEVLDKYRPNIAICNCGEATFSNSKPITMGTKNIQELCRYSPSLRVVAVHMEAWNHCVLTRDALKNFVVQPQLSERVSIPQDTYGVFVLDLGIVFPVIAIAATKLVQNKPFGNVLAGVVLVKAFTVCLSWGFGECYGRLSGSIKGGYDMLAIPTVLTLISLVFFIQYIRKLKVEV